MKTKYVKLFEEYSHSNTKNHPKFLSDVASITKQMELWSKLYIKTPSSADVKVNDPAPNRSRIDGTYVINDDMTVTVIGSVFLKGLKLKQLPIKFKEVSVDFDLESNELITLEGSPVKVGGWYECSYNPIQSLKYSPLEIGGNFYCNTVKSLISWLYAPTKVGDFYEDGVRADKSQVKMISNKINCLKGGSDYISDALTPGTVEERYKRYSAYLNTLSLKDKLEYVDGFSKLDSELSSAFIQYAVDNNLTDIYSDRVVGVNKNISTRQNKRMPLI